MLYAASPQGAASNPNTILPINPLTGIVGTPIPVGTDPGKLVVSDNGSYLYVALNAGHALQRINLKTLVVEATFPLPADPSLGATTVNDMHVVPGTPTSIVAALLLNASQGQPVRRSSMPLAWLALFLVIPKTTVLMHLVSPQTPPPFTSFCSQTISLA